MSMSNIPEFNTNQTVYDSTEDNTTEDLLAEETETTSQEDDDFIEDSLPEDTYAEDASVPVEEKAEVNNDDFTVEIDQPAVNFEIKRSPSKALDKAIESSEFRLAFIAENPKTIQKILNAYDDILQKMSSDEIVVKQKDKDWLESLVLGMHYISDTDAPIGATEREDSKWTQGVYGNDKENLVRPGRPSQKIEKNKRYSKEELLSYLSRKTGGGGTYDIMLPNSGLWLRLREPGLSEIVTLLTEIEENKVRVGMDTKGLAFGNATAVAANSITTLALNCAIAANINFNTPSDLEEHISILDEPILHYALAAVMYPDGFNYKVPCIANITNCSEVIDLKLNMSNVIWYDDLKFTKEQRKLLSRRFSRISTLEEIAKYKDEFTIGEDKIYWFNEIGVKLTIPNLYQRRVYVDAWIESLVDMTGGTFNEGPDGPNRSAYINKLNEATKAMHFGQWVKGIYEKDESAENDEDQLITEDPEIIKEFLANTLSKEELIEDFFEAVAKFSNESITGLVALPSHVCPSCNGKQGSVLNDRFPHLVPIDVIPVFFTLAGRKVQRIQGR